MQCTIGPWWIWFLKIALVQEFGMCVFVCDVCVCVCVCVCMCVCVCTLEAINN